MSDDVVEEFTSPAAPRRTAFVALSVSVLAVAGIVVLTQRSDTPDRVETIDTQIATTTTEVAPVFAPATASTTPATIASTSTTTTSTTTTTTTIAPTTTVADTLPAQETTPIAPPADPRGYEDENRLGSLSIPKLGVDVPMFEGIRLTTLDKGPGHWPGTAMPGQVGNVVVAGHRTSHGAPFRHIDQLVAGDTVVFTTDAGAIEYVVTGTQIVGPDALWIVDPTSTPTATLFACHPPGSTRQRIVVNLELR